MKRTILFPASRMAGAVCSVVCVVAALASAEAAVPSDSSLALPAGADAIVYEGRTAPDPAEAGAVRLGFPGVTAHLRFHGAGLTLRATASSDDCYFDVSLDGAAPTIVRLKKGPGRYPLVSGASDADHTLALTRRTESWQGVCALEEFELAAGGRWLAAPELPLRKLMFIGDSVTCGAMAAWQPGPEHADTAIDCDGAMSYGMVLARQLGAQCQLVSYGGRGIVRDWQGIRDTNNAPQFYERALPDDPKARWNPADYVPDAIGIQLGTNDFNPGIPDENEFVNTYVEFIRKVRRDAPQAWIVVMDSPIVTDDDKGPRRSVLHAYLEHIVQQVHSDQVVLAPIRHYSGVPHNGHPTGADHVAIAAELAPVFRRLLGW